MKIQPDVRSCQVQLVRERLERLRAQARDLPEAKRNRLCESVQQACEALAKLQETDDHMRLEHDEAQTRFAESQTECRHFRELFERAPDGLLTTDRRGSIQLANAVARCILGEIHDDDQPQPSLAEFVVPAQRRRFRALVRRIGSKTDGFEPCEWHGQLEAAGGDPPRSVVMRAGPTLDAEGEQVGLQWTISDVSDQVRSEQALRSTRDALSHRVEQSTARVEQANRSLRSEIAGRERAETQARTAESFNDALVNSLPSLFVLFDTDGKLLRWNPSTERLTGYSHTELEGLMVGDCFAPEDREAVIEMARESHEGGPASLEATLLTRDNRRLPHLITGVRTRRNGKPCFAGIGVDISEHLRAESAVRESESRFRTIAEGVGDLIDVLDPDCRRLYWSPSYRDLLGDSVLMIGEDWCEQAHPDERDRLRERLDQVVAEGAPGLVEYHLQAADGSTRVIESQLNPIRDDAGAVSAVVAISRDITERKARERDMASGLRDLDEALRQEEQARRHGEEQLRLGEVRYRHLVEHAEDIVFELDQQRRITYCNQKATFRILGYRAEELIGRDKLALVAPSHREEVRKTLEQQVQRRGTRIYFEAPVMAKDGRTVWLGHHAQVLWADDHVLGFQAVCRDVTAEVAQRHQLERSEAQLRELSVYLQARLEDERARIARELHDELGAALTAIRLDLGPQAGTTGRAPSKARVRRALRQVDSAIVAVRRICSDLRPSLLDTLGLWAAIEWQVHDVQLRSGLRCELNMQGTEIEPDRNTATTLFRIVQEALTNAIRHAGATRIVVDTAASLTAITLEVRDNGRGIQSDAIDASGALGLLGMQERARAVGGHVEVGATSEGTTVRVHVPLGSK